MDKYQLQYFSDIETSKSMEKALWNLRLTAWAIRKMPEGKAKSEAAMQFCHDLVASPRLNSLLLEDTIDEMRLNSKEEIEELEQRCGLPTLKQMRMQIRQGRRIAPP